MNILIFGNGYVAKAFSNQFDPHQLSTSFGVQHLPQSDISTVDVSDSIQKITTTSRSHQNAHTVLFDNHYRVPVEIINQATHILITIPPHEGHDVVLQHHHLDLLHSKSLKWIGYLSSSGVYGDHQGAWIDEDAPLKPSSPRSVQRHAVEQQWINLYRQDHLPVHIFRLSGIYGPGRSAIDNLLHGTAHPIDKPGHVFNRIHISDIIQILYASMRSPNPGRCYNVSDDEPASQVEVIKYAAQIMQVAMPAIVDYQNAKMSDMMAEFLSDTKRLKNQRIRQELNIKLLYPTYKQGLDALWKLVSPQ